MAPGSGGCGLPAGPTWLLPPHGPSNCHPSACCAPPGACRVKTRTRSSCSLCQNLESRAPGGERAARTGERAISDTPFLSLTVSYVRLDVRSTRLRWMGPSGGRVGFTQAGVGQGSSRHVRRPGAGGWGLGAQGWGCSSPFLFFFFFHFLFSSSPPEQLAPLTAVNHRERAFAEGEPSLLSTKPAETREGGGQALPLSACAARPAGAFQAETGTQQGRLLLPLGLGPGLETRDNAGDVKRKSDE